MLDPLALRLPPPVAALYTGPCCPHCGAHLCAVADGWHCFSCQPAPAFHPEVGATTSNLAGGW